MRLNLLPIALALSSAIASPNPSPEGRSLKCRAACNADNCLRAVRASSAKPGSASASSDCVSFFQKTIQPCPVTSTVFTTVTQTATPTTAVQIQTVIAPSSVTYLLLVTTPAATVEGTATTVVASEVSLTSTVIVKVVTVSTTVVPSASTASTTAVALDRRAANGTCAATTQMPLAVPTYASACSGTVRYSSACSCIGVTATTTTLTVMTTTSTVTVVTTTTPAVTVTEISTITSPTTVVQTSFVPTTVETTDATVTLTSLYSSVVQTTSVTSTFLDVCSTFVTLTSLYSSVVQTTSVTSTFLDVCSTFVMSATAGPYAGKYLRNADGDSVMDGTASNAAHWVLQNTGIFYTGSTDQLCSPFGDANFVNIADPADDSLEVALNCTIASSGPGLSPSGPVTCYAQDGTPNFVTCNTFPGAAQYLEIGGYGNCFPNPLVAIPACS